MSISHPRVATQNVTARRRQALLVLCFVEFMLVLDDTVVNVALPTIRGDLGFRTAGLAWVVNAYFLAFGGLLLLFGRAADLLGRRRLFLAGVLLFAVASVGCGLAQEAWQLVAGRFAQGTGAAMASPAALALVSLLFPGERERAKAFGIWGSVAVLGGTSGLVISGALTGLASWRWIFFINAPIAAVALVLIPRLVAESRSPNPERMDIPGTMLGTCALVSVVYGLLNAADAGWGATATIAPLVLASVLMALFLLVEAYTTQPLVPPSFLASRARAVAVGVSLPFTAAFFSTSFLLMLHLQTVLGHRPLAAGLAFLPYAAGILAGVTASSRLVSRLGPRWALVTSFLISAVGLLLLSGVSPNDTYLADVLPGMIIASFGGGIGFPALTVAALAGTTDEDAGVGSAVVKAVQQVGGAVGLAILVNLATRRSESVGGGSMAAFTEGLSLAFTVAAAVLVLGALAVAAFMRATAAVVERV